MMLGVWITAARPKTLWASVSPVIVGSAIAWRDDVLHLPSALTALAGGVLIQIGTNLANDLFDHLHGADTEERRGPLRVTQSGLATPSQVHTAMVVAFTLAVVAGVYLVVRGGWPIVGIGLLSIAAGILYTAGPYPLGYHGWGDLLVFIFFGPVAVVGTYYVQALETTPLVWLASIPMGALATAILVVNNLRDAETDRRAGKLTLAVRLGRGATIGEYVVMVMAAAAIPAVMLAARLGGVAVLAASVPPAAALPYMLARLRAWQPEALSSLLANTARLQLLYALVFATGINL